jgi:hypothetical protein
MWNSLIGPFFHGAWIGGQALYWLLLRRKTEVHGTRFWQALRLRFEEEIVEGEL